MLFKIINNLAKLIKNLALNNRLSFQANLLMNKATHKQSQPVILQMKF